MSIESPSSEPVGLTVHNLPAVAVDSRARTRLGRLKLLLVLLVCASPVIASYFTYFVIRPEGRTNYATLIQPSRTLPDLGLRTLDGQAITQVPGRSQWRLVVVDSGRCDTDCEQRLYMQRQLREMMGRERDRMDKWWLVLDEEPVPDALRAALEATPGMQIMRARRDQVEQWLAAEPGHALRDHLYLVDPMGEWMMRAPAAAEPAKFKKDLERLLRASSFWDQPDQPR